MKKSKVLDNDEMPAEINFSAGVRGKYAVKFPKGSRLVLLDSDVAEVFRTPEATNQALRDLAIIIKRTKAAKPTKATKAAASRSK